jgi:UDP-glucose 4-epimerase
MPKRVLVSGASGFVGANLVRKLVEDGHDVNLILRPQHETWRLAEPESVANHIVDLADRDGVTRTVQAVKPDWIFHLAAHGAYSSQTDVTEMVQTNLVGTVNLVEACLKAGFEAFVNTGSSSEYGYKDHAPTETELLEPNSHYAVTKASATLYCRFAAQTFGMRLRTLRLYSVYGPWEEPTRLIPTLIVNGLKGKLPTLADPEVARDYVYTGDVCDAYVRAATDPNTDNAAIFNVGTGIQTSLRQVVEAVTELLGIDEAPQWGSMPNRKWDTTTWVADSHAIAKDLGWRPRYSLREGLEETVGWLRANPAILAYYETRIGPDQPMTVKSTGGSA